MYSACVSPAIPPSLPTDLTETIYSVGAQSDHGWEALLHAYTASHSEVHKHKILKAMSSSRDTSKLSRCGVLSPPVEQ